MKWKLVPADVVTGEMVAAGIATPVANTGNDDVDRPEDYKQVFLSMLEAAPQPPSVPDADLVRDAERYRWLRAYNTAKHPAVTEAFFLGDENLDSAIDAAIAAEKGGAAIRAMSKKGQS